MVGKKDHNNPKREFKEQDDLVVTSKTPPVTADRLTSIRESELTSTAPDEINWNNIYFGKQHGLHSKRPRKDSSTGRPRRW